MEPKIRFNGFKGEWKVFPLSQLTSMHARIGWQNLRKDEFLNKGDYYLITGTDFIDGNVDFNTCHYVDDERYKQDKNIQLKEGSILITKDGTLGKVAYIDKLDKPATLNAGVFNVVCKSPTTDSKYLFQYLKSPLLMNYVDSTATGGTIKHLNQNILVNFPVKLPDTKEQVRLGKYFKYFDSLIQSITKKIASLRQMKAASLQAMFPQNGESTPKVRFKGFEGEWKIKSFDELYKHSSIKNDLSFDSSKIISVANMYFKDEDKNTNEDYLLTYNIMKLGDIAFEGNKSKSFAHGRFVVNDIGDGIVSHVFVVFSPKSETYDISFWKYYINDESIMRHKLIRCTKSSTMMKDLVVNDFLKESILVPSLEEQQKIGSFFRSLDRKIALETARLEKLKQIKLACLDKMFV